MGPAQEVPVQLCTGAAGEAEGRDSAGPPEFTATPEQTSKWGDLRFERSCVAADLSSFPPLERTKLSKRFQERIQSNPSPRDANETGGLEK